MLMLNEVHAEVAVSWVVTHELVLSMPSFVIQRAVYLVSDVFGVPWLRDEDPFQHQLRIGHFFFLEN